MRELAGVGRFERFGHGRRVVILSNPQADPRWWAPPIVSALTSAGYEAVTFVHAGPGYAPADVARDVGTFIEHLGPEPVHLLGWSQGAAIAQEVAALRPDLVAAAALIASYGRQNTFDSLLQQAWECLDLAGPELDPVRLVLLFLTSHPAEALGDDAFVDPLVAGMQQWSTKPDGFAESRERSREFIRQYQERLDVLGNIRVPCLVMGFGQDADTFVIRAREVAAAIPGSQYVELANAGHLAPVTEPQRVAGPILEFFAEIDIASRE
ncbi:pimeloyl-ACP methyl ester carboxylesterase [Micromonospora kangleipakensis]|uniref:Pimeloyl-ACP methyl ester carboxylesterase n=1 Tax=Micromonospora kangleipakensis TaxID=1077942 RepID=A0A4Q8B8N7_9ACTN|nr:alpha/beta hydrolase [Micromonospora kangleipakensis]RZU73485.1 pimeloyl-ACP methyl ester carboxylesterase [Micromonospora kangleipakensis]